MPKTERQVQQEIRLELPKHGATIFRVNVGQSWTGDYRRLEYGSVLISNPRPFNTGLPPGASDLLGFTSIEITPEMVGQRVAVFTAIECKRPGGKPTAQQEHFIGVVQDAGGLAGIAQSVEDAIQIVNRRDNNG